MELLVKQLSRMNQPRNNPPLPPATDGDWFDDVELPRGEVPRVKKEKAEKERQEILEMTGKMEKLERVVRKTHKVDTYMLELERLFDGVSTTLPKGSKMPEIDWFDGIGNPKNHVCICIGPFQSRGLSPTLMVFSFQQTLIRAVLSWHFTMDTHKITNWEGVVKAFITQYEYIQQLNVTIKDLETTRQEFKESLVEFLTR